MASKALSIIITGLLCLTLYYAERKNAWLFTAFFLSDTMSNIFFRTWSEVPFLLGILLFALSLYHFYYTKSTRWLVAIIVSAIFLFLCRYIGAVSLIPIAILGCVMFHQGDKRSFFRLAAAAGIILLLVVAMILVNRHFSGYAVGFNRIANQDAIPALMNIWLMKELEDVKLILIAGLAFLALRRMAPHHTAPAVIDINNPPRWPFYLLVGISYGVVVIIYRWLSYFDYYGNRIMVPMTMLLAFAALDYMQRRADFLLFAKCFLVLMLGAFLYQAPFRMLTAKQHYSQTSQQAIALYTPIPAGSIVLAGDYDMLFYRHDIQPAAPYPYFGYSGYYPGLNGEIREDIGSYEPLANYIARRCTGNIKAIYVDSTRWKHQPEAYRDIALAIHAEPGIRLVRLAICKGG